MTVIKLEAQLPSDELIKAVEQLDAPELERFVAQVLARGLPTCVAVTTHCVSS